MRKRHLIVSAGLGLALTALTPAGVFAGDASGRHSVWREDCGPYGHRGPNGCIPGGQFGAGSYYFFGPEYDAPHPFVGPPNYGKAPDAAEQPDYGVGYWGTRPYNIPAFQ